MGLMTILLGVFKNGSHTELKSSTDGNRGTEELEEGVGEKLEEKLEKELHKLREALEEKLETRKHWRKK